MTPLIRLAALANYCKVARAVGLNPEPQLRAANIAVADLDTPDMRVPALSVVRLLESSARRAGVEDFGLRMAEGRQPSNLGPLGLVIRAEPTLRAAIACWQRYAHLHSEATSILMLDEHEGLVVLSLHTVDSVRFGLRQSVEMTTAVLHGVLRSVLGPRWRARSVCFRHSPPRDLNTHRRMFGGPVQFNCEFDGVVCGTGELDTPIPGADQVMARYLHQYLESLAATPRRTLAQEVRHVVDTLLPHGQCSAEEVARRLGLAPRTFYLHMQQQEIDYSAILNAARKDAAAGYLRQPERRLSDIAGLLGFSGLSVFSRWFRHQYGCSATDWRNAAHTAATAHEKTAASV